MDATAASSATATAPATTRLELFVAPAAARKIYEGLQKRGTPESALRVGVRGGGCSGFSYVLEFADTPAREGRDFVFRVPVEPRPGDVDPPGPVKVYCDKKSIVYLAGSTLDWEKTLKWQGFKFVNPQSKQACGCKESFSI
ncbi:MAG: iron-sulfur cluster assembly accessory protein [Myxococcales bacterium]|nr:iron-sulfur cluster assembly accessory protein [Myxococcales bacterium]